MHFIAMYYLHWSNNFLLCRSINKLQSIIIGNTQLFHISIFLDFNTYIICFKKRLLVLFLNIARTSVSKVELLNNKLFVRKVISSTIKNKSIYHMGHFIIWSINHTNETRGKYLKFTKERMLSLFMKMTTICLINCYYSNGLLFLILFSSNVTIFLLLWISQSLFHEPKYMFLHKYESHWFYYWSN